MPKVNIFYIFNSHISPIHLSLYFRFINSDIKSTIRKKVVPPCRTMTLTWLRENEVYKNIEEENDDSKAKTKNACIIPTPAERDGWMKMTTFSIRDAKYPSVKNLIDKGFSMTKSRSLPLWVDPAPLRSRCVVWTMRRKGNSAEQKYIVQLPTSTLL